jgi:hypothetical protein
MRTLLCFAAAMGNALLWLIAAPVLFVGLLIFGWKTFDP